jgi:tRNA pseudouridine32 synthase/23S rRNA pseudouridine746 synthase
MSEQPLRPAGSPPSLTPEVVYQPPPDTGLELLHEDAQVLVVNKPAGLLSVPGRGDDRQDCLIHRVQRCFPEAQTVHRLDMATSGLVMLARGDESQRTLSALFRGRQVEKQYVALVHGLVAPDEGEIDLPLVTDWPRRPMQKVCHDTGKPSLTRFKVLSRDPVHGRTRVALEPVTGRTHQLRVHLLAIGHPIVGDPLYGPDAFAQGGRQGGRLCLHAERLSWPDLADVTSGLVISCVRVADF